MKAHHYAQAPRFLEIVAGLVFVIVVLLLALAFVATLSAMLRGNMAALHIWSLVFFALVGFASCLLAWRLLSGRGRRDGGLFSPFSLRVASLISLFAGLVMAWRHPLGLLELVPLVAAAGACLGLARLRERQNTERVDEADDR